MRRPLPGDPAIAEALARSGGRAIIVSDGDCVLCSASAESVLRRDARDRVRLTTAQGRIGKALDRAAGLEPGELRTMLLVERNGIVTLSDAAIGIARALGWPWRSIGLFRLAPATLRDRAYLFAARNRYCWSGRRAACWTPRPSDRERVL